MSRLGSLCRRASGWAMWLGLARRGWACAAMAVIAGLLALPAAAHKSSDSYLAIKVAGEQVQVQWDIALKEPAPAK